MPERGEFDDNRPTPPAVKLTEMRDIASFQPGYWKGRYFSPEFVKQLYDNFQKFSSGDNPYYVPFLNINHDDTFRYGRIVQARMDGNVLKLSARDIPEPVAQWANSKMLGERSIEFYEPKTINGKLEGFVDPAGRVSDTPVIRCLSLLGNEAPAVKGLGSLPKATYQDARSNRQTFRDSRGVKAFVSRFSDQTEPTKMSQELVDKLKELGFDVSLIPADATDDLLNAIIAAIQGTNANPPAAPPTDTPPATMSQPAVAPAAPAPAPVLPAMNAQPSQITTTAKFMEDTIRAQVGAYLSQHQTTLNQLRANGLVELARLRKDDERRKESLVETFLDEVKSQVTPAMRPGVKSLLMKCDTRTVKTFADGKTTGTDLDEQMKLIRDSYPVHRNAPTGKPVTVQKPINQAGTSDPGRVERMLKATPEGRAALAKQTTAAK